jgi:hypothetical protein
MSEMNSCQNHRLAVSRERIAPLDTRSLWLVFEQKFRRPSWDICLTDAWKPAGPRRQASCFVAKFYSRSHDAVIRVYDAAGNVIETHEHRGDFKEW